MQRRTKFIAAIGTAVLAVAVGTGAAVVGDDDGDDVPLEGADLEKAKAAALEHTGGGRVTETEAGDGESSYEVEVRLDDGSEVEVQLDEKFQVVFSGNEADDD